MLLIGDIPELEDFEGDLLLTKVQKAMITPLHQDVAAAGVWSKTQFMWPERTVPYLYYIPSDLGKITPSIILFCHSRAIRRRHAGNGVVKNNYSLYVRNNLVCFAVYVAMLTNSHWFRTCMLI